MDSIVLPALNDGLSGAVDISIGFAFGNSTQTAVYVSVYIADSIILLY